MFSMKMLLATADRAESLDDLNAAVLITKKMLQRLEAEIDIRQEEENSDEPTLSQLFEELE